MTTSTLKRSCRPKRHCRAKAARSSLRDSSPHSQGASRHRGSLHFGTRRENAKPLECGDEPRRSRGDLAALARGVRPFDCAQYLRRPATAACPAKPRRSRKPGRPRRHSNRRRNPRRRGRPASPRLRRACRRTPRGKPPSRLSPLWRTPQNREALGVRLRRGGSTLSPARARQISLTASTSGAH